jgi:molybdenum ABC transporter molybdate-binding protein
MLRRCFLLLMFFCTAFGLPALQSTTLDSPPSMRAHVLLASSLMPLKKTLTGMDISTDFKCTSDIINSLESGEPFDAFVVVGSKWRDRIKDLKNAPSRAEVTERVFAFNGLILAHPNRPDTSKVIESREYDIGVATSIWLELINQKAQKIIIAKRYTVPLGKHSFEVLDTLGLTYELPSQIISASSAHDALERFVHHEAPYAILYASDIFHASTQSFSYSLLTQHSPIEYVLVVKNESIYAEELMRKFFSPDMRSALLTHHFKPVAPNDNETP